MGQCQVNVSPNSGWQTMQWQVHFLVSPLRKKFFFFYRKKSKWSKGILHHLSYIQSIDVGQSQCFLLVMRLAPYHQLPKQLIWAPTSWLLFLPRRFLGMSHFLHSVLLFMTLFFPRMTTPFFINPSCCRVVHLCRRLDAKHKHPSKQAEVHSLFRALLWMSHGVTYTGHYCLKQLQACTDSGARDLSFGGIACDFETVFLNYHILIFSTSTCFVGHGKVSEHKQISITKPLKA